MPQSKDQSHPTTSRMAATATSGLTEPDVANNAQVEDLVDIADMNSTTKNSLHWRKRASPWWLLAIVPIVTIAYAATIAPRIEIYTYLACREQRPDSSGSIFNQTLAIPGNSSFDEEPPCASDPAVQAAAAKLIAVITTLMGILTCITTGFWGSFSDRYGRTRVMAVSVLGSLIADVVYISVVHFYEVFPGGSWFLLAAPVAEGLLGGFAAGEAALQSYMADVTDDTSRSRFFSLTMGLMLVGVAVGPTLGSLLISITHSILAPFYLVAALHAFLILFCLFVLPESVSKENREKSKDKYRRELHISSLDCDDPLVSPGLFARIERYIPFLRPLVVFLPHRVESANPLKKNKRDWSLTLVALGYASTIAIMACYPFKLQYARATFNWDTVDVGYFMGLVGLTSGVYLILIFPFIIKFLRPKPIIIKVPISSDHESHPSTTIKKEIHSPHFDLNLVIASLLLNITAYLTIALSKSALVFTVAGMIGSLGLGFSPAVQSVALALYTKQGGTETGRLFGGLGVISALCSQFVGPSFYGAIYANTVASYPRTIFFVCAASLSLALLFTLMIRIPEQGSSVESMGVDLDLDLEETEPLIDNNGSRSRSYGSS